MCWVVLWTNRPKPWRCSLPAFPEQRLNLMVVLADAPSLARPHSPSSTTPLLLPSPSALATLHHLEVGYDCCPLQVLGSVHCDGRPLTEFHQSFKPPIHRVFCEQFEIRKLSLLTLWLPYSPLHGWLHKSSLFRHQTFFDLSCQWY